MYSDTKYYYSPYPIIDETGMKGMLGRVKLDAVTEDYKSLDKALQEYGIRFALQEREVDVLVITEVN